MSTNQRLKQIREERNLDVSDIAQLLGASPKQVVKWESGERSMPMRHYIKLARFYNLRIDYIAQLIDMPMRLTDDG